MSTRTLFSTEEKIIHKSETLLSDEARADNPLLNDYKDLFKSYKKLYKQSSRLIKISDRQQDQLRNAEAALRESEEKYRGLYNSSIDGILYVDMNDCIQDANPSFLEMSGYTAESLKNKKIVDLIPPKWHEALHDIKENQILSRGRSDEYEEEMIDKQGNCLPVSVCSWLIRDEQENPIGIWSIIRDISERKRAEQLKEDVERMVRHDLKTPLNGVIGLSQQLLVSIDQEIQMTERLESKIQALLIK
ncbi:MAG: PAS domain S-box protein [Candidatus Magnetomorum sp.]|nr:PAS domain S-box protein [Candidatus Magnetomorum sp.]